MAKSRKISLSCELSEFPDPECSDSSAQLNSGRHMGTSVASQHPWASVPQNNISRKCFSVEMLCLPDKLVGIAECIQLSKF